MSCRTLLPEQRWILKGIPVLFLIGSFMHFLYDLSWQNPLAGLIAPVNESVWEHTKMVLLPVILWWAVYYIINGRRYDIDKNKWFTGALVSLVTSIMAIPLLYYFYTGAFGVEILAVDISILLLAILFGQLLGLHFYKFSKGIDAYLSIAIMIVIIFIFIAFTIYPPHLPIFRDSMTGKYGIGQ